ncbi:MAG: putative glycoside hydrolase, partial [Elusimicrobiota bacterium]
MLKIILFLLLAQALPASAKVKPSVEAAHPSVSTTTIRKQILSGRAVRGIHLTSWGSGSKKTRGEIIAKIKNSVINTVVIAIKETDGKVYIPGIAMAHKYNSYESAISQPEEMLKDFKGAGIYTIARVVVFKDKVMPLARKDLAVHTPDGGVWRATKGATWLDPYNKEVWEYTLDVAERAAKLGFDEI